jgi:PAS domain-containing protein
MPEQSLIIGLVSTFAALGAVLAFLIFRARSSRRLAAVAGAHYHALIEQSPNGVLIADASSLRVIAGNSALQRSLGYKLEELRSLTLSQIFTDESAEPETCLPACAT